MTLFSKKFLLLMLLGMIILQLIGCGETAQGISKDIKRVNKGVRTIFIRESK